MATLEQLSMALKNADAAGDTAAARKLATAIQQMRGTPSVGGALKPVTDPAILQQLNAGSPQAPQAPPGLKPVTDPAILQQLNASFQNQVIDVRAPDGSIARFPPNTPDAVIEKAMREAFPPPPLNWSDVPGRALQNLGPSALQFGKDIVQPIVHPVETATNLGSVGKGAFQNAMQMATGSATSPTDAQQKASAVWQFLKDRFGSEEAVKHTIANDPVGFLGDLSTVLTGGETAVARLPMIGAKAARVAKIGAEITNPINIATKAVVKPTAFVARTALASTTGVSPNTIKTAAEAGKVGSQSFRENLRGAAPEQLLAQAKDAVSQMRDEKHANYLNNIAATKANQAVIPMAPIQRKAMELRRSLQLNGHWKTDARGQAAIEGIDQKLMEWQSDPSMHNAIGLDALKQSIESMRPAMPSADENRIFTTMSQAIKGEISARVPSYRAAMKSYEEASALEQEIIKTMSLGRGATQDTAIRKLLSSTRHNVNTNFGRRQKLIDILNQYSPGLKEGLAGQAMNSWLPRGLQLGEIPAAAGLAFATHNPFVLGAIPAMSPRFVGEGAYYTGRAAGLLSNFGPRARVTNPLFQTGRGNDGLLSR